MKKALYLALFLAIVAALSALALSVTNNITEPIIKANEVAADKSNLELIFPGADFEKLENVQDATGTIDSIYKAGDLGYVYKMVADGFGGKGSISFMVGFENATGTIKGFIVTDASAETKGIGSQITEDKFINSVIGKASGDEVDAISGATISSTGVKNGLNVAAKHFATMK